MRKLLNGNKKIGFSFKLQKQIILWISNSKLWIAERSCNNEQYILKY